MKSTIRAVSLDVGGTLITPWPSVGHAYARVAERFGLACCPERLTERFTQTWKSRHRFGYTRHEWFEVVRDCFEHNVPEQVFQAIYDHFAEPHPWRIYDDVFPAIEWIRDRGLKLAAVSNWDDRLRPLLDNLSLGRHFDAIIVSGELGAHKPDPRIFQVAAASLNFRAEEVLHIGDSQREDADGAAGAGMRGLKIERKTGDELLRALQTALE